MNKQQHTAPQNGRMGNNMGKNKGRILYNLLTISILPLIVSVFLVLIIGYYSFTHTMHTEIYTELKNTASYAITYIDSLYPGDYKLEEENGYRLYKGGVDITESYRIVDHLKTHFGFEATLFYSDTRILTTVYDSQGVRKIATGAPETVLKKVLRGGETLVSKNVNVNGRPYFVCYTPLHNSDGSIVGIFAVGRPQSNINQIIQSAIYPMIFIILITCVIMSFGIIRYTKGVVGAFGKIQSFLSESASGNQSAELDPSVTTRNDELGKIGQAILSMQRSMRNMAEQDALTGLFNRRSANRKLTNIIAKSETQSVPFSVALGDIDFFKKVNDTYGHECGDEVLKRVSDTMREFMLSLGFVSRWGGEEFLLVFDHSDIKSAAESMQKLLEQIRTIEIPCENRIVKVTMTFGVICGENIPLKDLVSKADKLLYIGKHSGRNQIVLDEDVEKELLSEPESDS